MFRLQDLIQCFCLCGGSSKQVDKVHRSDPPMPANVFLHCISQLQFSIVFLNIISQLYFAIVHSYAPILQRVKQDFKVHISDPPIHQKLQDEEDFW